MSAAFASTAMMDPEMEILEVIAAVVGLVLAVLVFAGMALSGAFADGVDLPVLRGRRHRTH